MERAKWLRGAGWVLLAGSLSLLLLLKITCIGMNDAEWERIGQAGTAPSPEGFVWSEWGPPHAGNRRGGLWPDVQAEPEEVREGVAKTLFHSFTLYEARSGGDRWMVLGAEWGAEARPVVPIAMVSGGVVLLLIAGHEKRRAP